MSEPARAPIWVSGREAVAIHEKVVARFGGLKGAMPGEVRDENLLAAALARPLNKWHYDTPRPDLFALAAAYAFTIARGHVFPDGSKRTAYVVALGFLALNGVGCAPQREEIGARMIALADGRLSESDFAEWLRANAGGRL